MKVHIALKDTSRFTLYNVIHLGLMKHLVDGKYRRIMYFKDAELGLLGYPVTDIVEMIVEG